MSSRAVHHVRAGHLDRGLDRKGCGPIYFSHSVKNASFMTIRGMDWSPVYLTQSSQACQIQQTYPLPGLPGTYVKRTIPGHVNVLKILRYVPPSTDLLLY